MTVAVRFLSAEEFKAADEARRNAVRAWQSAHPEIDCSRGWPAELRAVNDEHLPPGSAWYCPWYHDPSKPEDVKDAEEALAALKSGKTEHAFLSIHYLETWATIRPPICVVCPGGAHWCPDQQSSNGTGWVVTGELPNITCSPSIWASQGAGPPHEYHGFLRDGVFTDPM